ncbi:hypothetical protein V6N12_063131 [Hibiscus sabdariffa]|uniref:RIN4 pathogenic type III effector avirulence factor Avr cleavage site domain-containing protein n=1 Tax=Hibiscus sabdariffa TaxID=183260 RepID=A0ABR2FAT7_9ROSI
MSEPKLHSHVPKFGDRDNDDPPYTTYSENARKDKAGTIDLSKSDSDSADVHRPNAGKIMNPIDHEENPEASMHMRGGLESNHDCSKSESTDKHRTSGASRNGSTDHQKSARRQRNMGPEPGSENGSGSGGTHMHSNHHRRTSSCPKNGPAGGGSFSGSGNYEYKHQRTTSVPKFGEWDETDPTSGEGFTVIFNKVKEEKHAAQPSNFATVAPEVETMDYSDCHHKKCPTPSWGSKSKLQPKQNYFPIDPDRRGTLVRSIDYPSISMQFRTSSLSVACLDFYHICMRLKEDSDIDIVNL